AAGNEFEDEFDFEVVERTEYEIEMFPGWNLISLPGAPVNPDINAVLPVGHPASSVLAYVNGEWRVATRGANGTWEGTLTQIDGTSAYWVQTGAFTPLETLVVEPLPSDTPTTIPVRAGWNMVPVIDVQLAGAGTVLAPASEYF